MLHKNPPVKPSGTVQETVARTVHFRPMFDQPGEGATTGPTLGEALQLEGAGPGRPRKGRRAERYRPAVKLARSRLAGELVRGMLPTLRRSPWATGGGAR